MRKTLGFTLVELLITLTVGSLVLMAILSIVNSFLRFQKLSQTSNSLINASSLVLDELTLQIHSAQNFETTFDCFTVFTQDDDIRYCHEDQSITKEILQTGTKVTLTPSDIDVTAFSIVDKSGVTSPNDPTPPLLEISYTFQSNTNVGETQTYSKTTTISGRKSRFDSFVNPTATPVPTAIPTIDPNPPTTPSTTFPATTPTPTPIFTSYPTPTPSPTPTVSDPFGNIIE